jgi:D,D-heptose 1,7-bisphosphate phosphatase
MNRAVFLDRDGVINEEVGFLHKKKDIKFYPQAIEALKILSGSAYKIIIITNQAGIGRGLYTEEEYGKFEKEYIDELAKFAKEIRIDKIYHCPHHPAEGVGGYKVDCECRKPKPGMLFQAQKDFNLNLGESYIIGDKRSDIEAGRAAGCKTILVNTGYGGRGGEKADFMEVKSDFITTDIKSALSVILYKAENLT